MSIGGIPGALGGIGGAVSQGATGAAGARSSSDASDAFGGLLSSLTRANGAADRAVTDIAVGSDQDLHDAVLAVQMESLTFDLAVQIRNRLVDAYQEMFRMSV